MAEELKEKETAAPKEEEQQAYITRPVLLKDFKVIKHFIATEESQRLQQEENALVVAVDKKANKLEIKRAIEAIFQVKVKSVNTSNPIAKTRRVGRYSGKLPAYKKAIVRLDSAYDLGKIASAVASEERQANKEAE